MQASVLSACDLSTYSLRCIALSAEVAIPGKLRWASSQKQLAHYKQATLSGFIHGLEVGRPHDAADQKVLTVRDAAQGSVGRARHPFSI